MTDELLELDRMRADLPPADEAAMARARASLVHMATSAPARRRRFPVWVAATTTVAAAAATFLLVPSAGHNAPTASAVTFNGDGTVTIELTDIKEMTAANNVLTEAGIRAELVNLWQENTCEPGVEPTPPLPSPDGLFLDHPRDEHNIVKFRPDEIPAEAKLVVFGGLGTLTSVVMEGANPTLTEAIPTVMVFGKLYPENSGICVDSTVHIGESIHVVPVPGN